MDSTVRRTGSHDVYDLLEPSLAAFVWLLIPTIGVIVSRMNLVVLVTGPSSANQTIGVYLSLMNLTLPGLAFSFIGVLVAEGASRIRNILKP